MPTVSENIVDAIIADLRSNKVLGEAWDKLDPTQQRLMRMAWIFLYHKYVDDVLFPKEYI